MKIQILILYLIRKIVPFSVYNYSRYFDYMCSVQSSRITKTNRIPQMVSIDFKKPSLTVPVREPQGPHTMISKKEAVAVPFMS